MVKTQGIDLAYVRRGSGETPLVLVHGYPLDHSIWEDVVPLLTKDFDVILPDLRGFGQSELVESGYSIGDMAGDIAGLLDHLQIPKVVIVGHSMGGYVSLAFVRERPERVKGLGLVASQAIADTFERKQSRYQTAKELMQSGLDAVVSGMSTMLSPNTEVQAFVRELIAKQRPAGLAGALMAMAEREDATRFLQTIRCPFVLIHGDADELIPIERAREIKVNAPDANLVELSGGGHMPMKESPNAVAKAISSLR